MEYSFSYDEQRVLLTLKQRGYWSLETFGRYEREYLAQHDHIRTRHRNYRVFADCADYPVQSTEVGEAFTALFAKLMSENKGHNAIIVSSALNRIQAQRLIPQPNVKIFTDGKAAMDWLFEPGSLPG